MDQSATRAMVIGGSNSVRLKGWVSNFRRRAPASVLLLNRSVGAASSLMGYYRLATQDDLTEGDVLFWEYALNDQNHIDAGGYDKDLLLRYCEYTIRLCMRRGVRFLPLIFATLSSATEPEMSGYRKALRRLFRHYQLRSLDVSVEVPVRLGLTDFPEYVYQDQRHYKDESFITNFIGRRAMMLLEKAPPPVRISPMFSAGDAWVEVFTGFEGGHQSRFVNRAMSVAAFSPGQPNAQPGGESPDCAPLLARIEGSRFALVGVVTLSTATGGAFRISTPVGSASVSACHNETEFNKPLLKVIALPMVAGRTFEFSGPVTIGISYETDPSLVAADFGFFAVTDPQALRQPDSRIVALLIEHLG